ncbi:MAG: hypothetical protein RL758_1798 [Pseudomonadota bacterium]|jgi:dUTP pyrophosphatase
MKLKIKKLDPAAQLPRYATEGAACFDLHALAVDDLRHTGSHVEIGQPVLCRTGLSFEVPAGHVMMIFSRSGHGFTHGIRLANCVGVIDSDYRGEVMVKLTQDPVFDEVMDELSAFIKPGDRIAQAMLVALPSAELVEVDELEATDRGSGGFGSTGA